MSAVSHEIRDHKAVLRGVEDSAFSRYESMKVWLEASLAVVLVVILAPIMLLTILLVRLTSRGPAIYTQVRAGLDGKPFTLLKVRSMYLKSEPNGPQWSLPGDPRVTPIGRFLRWSHLDELPQLINVIRGEMSLIGPRPERPEIVSQLEHALPHYRLRLAVRPGLTGLAQVLQAPDTDLGTVRRKLNYDLFYISRLSFWLDARVAVGTVLLFFQLPGRAIAAFLKLPYEES